MFSYTITFLIREFSMTITFLLRVEKIKGILVGHPFINLVMNFTQHAKLVWASLQQKQPQVLLQRLLLQSWLLLADRPNGNPIASLLQYPLQQRNKVRSFSSELNP